MGTSVYFSARRGDPLSEAERAAIGSVVKEFSVEDQIDAYLETGLGLNWESFSWRAIRSESLVFTGAVRLPDVTVSAMLRGVAHWGRLLGRVRSEILDDAEWDVHVDGRDLVWLEAQRRYALSTTS